eukprot:UN00709
MLLSPSFSGCFPKHFKWSYFKTTVYTSMITSHPIIVYTAIIMTIFIFLFP